MAKTRRRRSRAASSRRGEPVARGVGALALLGSAAALVGQRGRYWTDGWTLHDLWQVAFAVTLVWAALVAVGVPRVGRWLGWLPAATTLLVALWFLLDPQDAQLATASPGRWDVTSTGESIALGVLLLGHVALFAGVYVTALRFPSRPRRRGPG